MYIVLEKCIYKNNTLKFLCTKLGPPPIDLKYWVDKGKNVLFVVYFRFIILRLNEVDV